MPVSLRHGLIVAAAAVAIVAAVLVVRGASSPYAVRVEFANAAGLRADFTVKVDGVTVGRVKDVSATARDTAIATLELDDGAAPLGQGARATILPSNLLGEKFVSLTRGDPRMALASNATIPISRSSVSTEIDQVVDSFDLDTRQALAVFLSEQGTALLGRGADIAAVLDKLPSGLQSARMLVAGLAHDNRALGRLVNEADRIVSTVAPQRRELGRLVRNAAGTFAALAGRQRELGETIEQAPSSIAQLRRTLTQLRAAAGPLAATARGLRRAAPSLTTTLHAVPGFARAARPALQDVSSTAPALQRLADGATPPLRSLRPTASALATFASSLAPISALADHGAINDLLGFLEGWARAIQTRDAAGHVFRIDSLLPPATIKSLLGYVLGRSPGRTKTAREPRPAITAPRPQLQLPEVKRPQPSTGKRPAIPALPQAIQKTVTDATTSVQKLLDYLLEP
jgi:virulence factor Mce-like protein